MKARNMVLVVILALIAVAAGNVVVDTRRRISSLGRRVAELASSMTPVHDRCEALEHELRGVSGEVADLEESRDLQSEMLSGLLAERDEWMESHAQRLSLVENRSDAHDQRLLLALTEFRSHLDQEGAESTARDQRLDDLERALDRVSTSLVDVPEGSIVSWIPGLRPLPPGWVLCDGRNGTPDLRGLFLRGASSIDGAGVYGAPSEMQPAGVHSHRTEVHRSIYNLSVGPPKEPGDWLILFDEGSDTPSALSVHGAHVHGDPNVPAHYTVVFIMKKSMAR